MEKEYIWQRLSVQEARQCRKPESIRYLLGELIPGKIQGVGICNIPFPGEWVSGIREEDFALMDAALGWGHQTKGWWAEIYWNLNLVFCTGCQAEEAQAIVKKMEELVKVGVPRAPLLLIPGAAFLLCHEPIKRMWARIEKLDTEDLKRRAEELKKGGNAIREALGLLLELAGVPPSVENRGDLFERISDRLQEDNFNIDLVGSLKKVEAILAEEEKAIDEDTRVGRALLDGFKLPQTISKPAYTWNAFDGLAKLIEKYDGWARKSAEEIFARWGMDDINDASERQYRSRMRKRGGGAKKPRKAGRPKGKS